VNATSLGLIFGLALGFAGALGGFGAFLIVLLFGVIGLLVGRYLDGQLDLSQLTGNRERRGER
jgi:nitrate/nitrite transporter NarK